MCQGTVQSLVKFRVGKRTRRVLLQGIGSHSGLIQTGRPLLLRRGWTENAPDQNVISTESDFTRGWNRCTLESGKPTPTDMRLLRAGHKRMAGSAAALIRHVRRCNLVDDALIALLTPEAWGVYDAAKADAQRVYDAAKADAWCALFRLAQNRVEHLR